LPKTDNYPKPLMSKDLRDFLTNCYLKEVDKFHYWLVLCSTSYEFGL